MSVAVRIDLKEGAGAQLTARGWTASRVAVVTGLTGSSEARLFQAVDALAGPPYSMRLGQRHPGKAGLAIVGLRPEPFGAEGAVKVTVEYAVPEAGGSAAPKTPGSIQIEGAASLQMEQADTDANKKPMVVQYTDKDGKTHRTPLVFSIGRPHYVLRLIRISWRNEAERFLDCLGSINGGSWRGRPTRTWRLNSIAARQENGAWTNAWEFEHNPLTWDVEGTYIDPETTRMPEGVKEGEGRRRFQVCSLASFSQFGFGG